MLGKALLLDDYLRRFPRMTLCMLWFSLGIFLSAVIKPYSLAMLALIIFYTSLFIFWKQKIIILWLLMLCLGMWRASLLYEKQTDLQLLNSEKVEAKIIGIIREPPWPTQWFNTQENSRQKFYKNYFIVQSVSLQILQYPKKYKLDSPFDHSGQSATDAAEPDVSDQRESEKNIASEPKLLHQREPKNNILPKLYTSHKFSTGIRVSLATSMPGLAYGDEVEIQGSLQMIKGPDNPGQADLRNYWYNQDVYYYLYVKNAEHIHILSRGNGNSLMAYVHNLRHRYLHVLREVAGHEYGNLLGALLLGSRTLLDDTTIEQFRRTGVIHLLAISGLHVAILMYFLYQILLRLRLPIIFCWATMIAFSGTYALLTNLQTPVVRTVIMLWIYFSALSFGRSVHSTHTISTAAFVILIYKPLELFQPGFHLTFLATLSIIKVYVPFATPWDGHGKKGWVYWRDYIIHYFWQLSLVSISTWIVTGPLVIYHFGCISWLGAWMSIITIPIVTIILALSALTAFTPLSLGYGGWILGKLLGVSVWLLLNLVYTGSLLPCQLYWLPPLTIVLIAFYLWIMSASFDKKRDYWLTALFVILVMFSGYARRLQQPDSEVTVLSVGHGCSIYAKLPSGQHILYDCGSRSNNIAEYVILPFLQYKGVTHLDAVVLSHFDSDHYNGIASIVEGCPPDRIYINAMFQQQGSQLVAELQAQKIKVVIISQLDPPSKPVPPLINTTEPIQTDSHSPSNSAPPLINTTEPIQNDSLANLPICYTFPELPNVQFLNPGNQIQHRGKTILDNEHSLLVLLNIQNCKIFFTGDMGSRSTNILLKNNQYQTVDVLIVPHHGGRLSNTGYLLSKFAPRLAIISNDATFGHSRTLEHYRSANIPLFSTYKYGALQLLPHSSGRWQLESFR